VKHTRARQSALASVVLAAVPALAAPAAAAPAGSTVLVSRSDGTGAEAANADVEPFRGAAVSVEPGALRSTHHTISRT
jgi:hypothetical protein